MDIDECTFPQYGMQEKYVKIIMVVLFNPKNYHPLPSLQFVIVLFLFYDWSIDFKIYKWLKSRDLKNI